MKNAGLAVDNIVKLNESYALILNFKESSYISLLTRV